MEKVNFLLENEKHERWGFTNLSRIAKFLDTQQSYVNYCMKKGKPCKGWKIIDHASDTNAILDNAWFLIEHRVNPTDDVVYWFNECKKVHKRFENLYMKIWDKYEAKYNGNQPDLGIWDMDAIADSILEFDLDKCKEISDKNCEELMKTNNNNRYEEEQDN